MVPILIQLASFFISLERTWACTIVGFPAFIFLALAAFCHFHLVLRVESRHPHFHNPLQNDQTALFCHGHHQIHPCQHFLNHHPRIHPLAQMCASFLLPFATSSASSVMGHHQNLSHLSYPQSYHLQSCLPPN